MMWRNRHRLSHLIVHTSGELDLPWEIVNLVPPPGEPDDGRTHFLADRGLTRWVYRTALPTEIRIRSAKVVAVAPDYRDANLRLPRAANEVAAIRDVLEAKPVSLQGRSDLSAIVAGEFDLLHFAGHGRWRATDPRAQQLLLAAFEPAHEDDSAAYDDANARTDLEARALPNAPGSPPTAPLVFLSACDVGRLQSGAAGIGGFAEAFLRGGAGVFIGCNWAVRDEVAARFVKSFYAKAFEPDTTIGEAALTARRDARRAGDLSALAFTVFGDPNTKLVRV
jgi:CHAT domain-containing protein